MKKSSKQITINIKEGVNLQDLFGVHDKHLKEIEKTFGVQITARGPIVTINGVESKIRQVENFFHQVSDFYDDGSGLEKDTIKFIIRLFKENQHVNLKKIFSHRVKISLEDKYITPKSIGQKEYVYAINNYDIVMGIGPAGTGKTYLAMAMAVSGLVHKRFSRIILTRPAVEAGEKLGYLPGDLYEKINPYLRPLYDALYDMMDVKQAKKLIETEVIEIAPLAYMRGRTLNDAFIILDEAQNSTPEQMKMFLTRLGFNSKMIITGDITQTDLPGGTSSGLITIQKILKPVEGIEFIYFSEKDVVRHQLVQKIIKAYEKHND